MLEARALYEGETHAAPVRVAEHDGAIYLDLCDAMWRAVAITADGWRLDASPPVRFRRARGMLPLPEPERGGSVELLHSLVNVGSDDDYHVLVAWLLAALRPRGPYPVLALHGEPGTAKTWAARICRGLVDPSASPTRGAPREERDLMIAARNGWVIAADNLSHIPDWLSDALCRVATGGGLATRELYSDTEETIIDVMRPVIVTGIAELATAGDLADRTLVLELPVIEDDRRRTDAETEERAASARPRLLGALLDGVAGALRELPRTRPARLPRLAEYATWATAAESALGWRPGTLLDAYGRARASARSGVIEASAVATAVLALLPADGAAWEGTATELLDALAVPESVRRDRYRWPQSGRGIAGALRRLGPALRETGVDVTWLPRTRGARRLRIASQGRDTTVTTVTDPATTGSARDGRAPAGDGPSPRPSRGYTSTGAAGDGGDGHIPTLTGDADREWWDA